MNSRNLLVLDISVAMHLLKDNLRHTIDTNQPDTEYFHSIVKAQLCHLHSLNWLPEHLRNSRVIYACDRKVKFTYWRHNYLKTFDINYKGQRRLPDKTFNTLKRQTIKISKTLGVTSLSAYKTNKYGVFCGYEADDIASAIVQVNSTLDQPYNITLATTDTDWLGLINPDVGWYSMVNYPPRYRNTLDLLNTWASRRLKTTFTNPRDLWAYKAKHGDASDNLPANSPLEVIDLLNPPPEHNLALTHRPAILKALTSATNICNPELEERAYSFLRKQGIPIFLSNG